MVLNLSNHINESPSYLHSTNHDAADLSQQYGAQRREDSSVRVTLQNKDMWNKFHHVGTEMIITKAGR